MRLLLMSLALCVPLFAKPTLYRVIYDDDPVYKKEGRQNTEWLYGAKLIIIPHDGRLRRGRVWDGDKWVVWDTHEGSLKVPGIVLHVDAKQDFKWVEGYDPTHPQKEIDPNFNILAGAELAAESIKKRYNVGSIVDDKWWEAEFLKQVAGSLKPPTTRLGNSFSTGTPELRAQVEKDLSSKLESLRATDPQKYENAIKLEMIRREIEATQGPSMIKSRVGFGSGNKLLDTTKDWVGEYLKGGDSLAHETLTSFLHDPESLVVQEKLNVQKEIRVHIINGKIVKGATFIRGFSEGQFLSEAKENELHARIEKELLSKLPDHIRNHFSAGMDIINGKITDLNFGGQSGFLSPEVDLLVASFVAEQLTGERPPILQQFEEFSKEPLGPKRIELLHQFLNRYSQFFSKQFHRGFWTHVCRSYLKTMGENPTSENLEAALNELKEAGLREARIYNQLLDEAQEKFPALKLTSPQGWLRFLERLDRKTGQYLDNRGHLYARRKITPPVCRPTTEILIGA